MKAKWSDIEGLVLMPRWLLCGPELTRDCEVIPQPRDAVNDMVGCTSTARHLRGIITQACISFLRVDKLVRYHNAASRPGSLSPDVSPGI